MHIEPQDRVLAPGALEPGDLGLKLELRWWRLARLLLFLRPRLLMTGRLGCLLLVLLWLRR
jgi:hypothetical protein